MQNLLFRENLKNHQANTSTNVRKTLDTTAVFRYRAEGYRAASGNILLEPAPDGRNLVTGNERPLGSFLGDEFLPCHIGLRGMYFDAVRELLLVPVAQNEVRAMPVELRHRVLIDVEELGA